MRRDGLPKVTFGLAAFVAAALLGFGVGIQLFEDFDSGADRLIFGLLGLGGGTLVVLGLLAFRTRPRLSALLITAGAALGAMGLFWTLVLPLLAIVLAVLMVMVARRSSAVAAAATAQ